MAASNNTPQAEAPAIVADGTRFLVLGLSFVNRDGAEAFATWRASNPAMTLADAMAAILSRQAAEAAKESAP